MRSLLLILITIWAFTPLWAQGPRSQVDNVVPPTSSTSPGTFGNISVTGYGRFGQNTTITSATYVSGVTATGTGTCILTFIGGGGSGAVGTIQITSGSVTGGNDPQLIITNPGVGYTSGPTSATVSLGTASSCSGTATITSIVSPAATWQATDVNGVHTLAIGMPDSGYTGNFKFPAVAPAQIAGTFAPLIFNTSGQSQYSTNWAEAAGGSWIAQADNKGIGSTSNPPSAVYVRGTTFGTTSTLITSNAATNRNVAFPDLSGQIVLNTTPPAGGGPVGGVSAITADSAAINTTETVIVDYLIPANSISGGTTYRFKAFGTCTSNGANVSTIKLYFGPNGDMSGGETSLATLTPTAAASGTNIPFTLEFWVTFRSTTSVQIGSWLNNLGNTGIYSTSTPLVGAPAATTGLTTNADRHLYFSYVSNTVSGATTSTFKIATIELVKP